MISSLSLRTFIATHAVVNAREEGDGKISWLGSSPISGAWASYPRLPVASRALRFSVNIDKYTPAVLSKYLYQEVAVKNTFIRGLLLSLLFLVGSSQALAQPATLLRTIPNPFAQSSWGASLSACPDGTVLVGSKNGWLGGVDLPVCRLNPVTGLTVQTYAEPALPQFAGIDYFGSNMNVVGDYVLVESYANVGADQSGCVHVYDLSTGAYLRTISHPNPVNSGSFGMSMAALGQNAVIGSFESNSAYIIDPATGAVSQRLPRPSGSTTEHFGASVATIGSDVLVGGYAGSVYRLDPSTGAVKATYADPRKGEMFGYSVAGVGDKVLVGSFKSNVPQSESGAVYVFNADTGTPISTILNPFPASGDWFGIGIAVYQNRYALIGAANDSGGGAAYLYDLNDSSLLATFNNPTPQTYDRFGQNLTWANGAAVITAWGDSGGAGQVYVFEGVPEPATISLLALGGLALMRRKK